MGARSMGGVALFIDGKSVGGVTDLKINFRGDAMRRVVIDGKYTYETDLRVGVGDIVDLPGMGSSKSHWQGRVTALESEYTGQCRQINAIVESRALEEANRDIQTTIDLQPPEVADAIRAVVVEVEKYGPVTLTAFAAAAGRLLAAAYASPIPHRRGFFGSRNPGYGEALEFSGVVGPLAAEVPEEMQA